MALTLGLVTFDALDPDALGSWWRDRLDATVMFHTPGEGMMIQSTATGTTLAFSRVADPTPGKNRLHLDFQADDREAETAAFVAAGATKVDTHRADGEEFAGMAWDVLADPEGNLFCIADTMG